MHVLFVKFYKHVLFYEKLQHYIVPQELKHSSFTALLFNIFVFLFILFLVPSLSISNATAV